MKKRVLKIISIIIFIFIIGGIGGFVFDKYLIPFLGSCKVFSRYDFLQGSGKNTTIIKETERIVVSNNNSINELSASASQSVVDIVAIKDTKFSVLTKLKDDGKKGVGTILTNDGVIVTHQENVFDKNSKYYITVFDGAVFDAKLVGIDTFSELAFLKIEGSNLPAIPFANSEDVIIGRKVIAIGGSLGSQKVSVNEGVLSNYNKTFNLAGAGPASSEKLEGIFKLGFNIDNNYVGSPVIDYNGELIAISSVLEIDNQKEFFQIPSNKVRTSMDRVFSEDVKKIAKLGVYYISIDEFYSRLNNLPVNEGAMIYSVSGAQGLAILVDSAAEKAGLKINDIIISIDDEKIDLNNSLSSYINKYKVGNKITLKVLRAGKEIVVSVAL